MTIASGRLIVLDTCVLIQILRNNDFGRKLIAEFALTTRVERPLYSTITAGELFGLAAIWNWGKKKLHRMDEILGQLVRVDAGTSEVVDAYATIYAESTRCGFKMGENDMWIAATARATGAVLLTTDKGFAWIQPALVDVIVFDL